MKWSLIAESVWRIRPWTAWALLALYAVPILRLVGFPLQIGNRFFMRVNGLFGRWEQAVCPLRGTVVSLWLAGGAIWYFWLGIERAEHGHFALSFAAGALLLVGWSMRRFKASARMRLLEFARRFPAIHPQEFFDHFFCSSGAVRHALPERPFKEIDPAAIDFRRGAPSARSAGPMRLIAGVASTVWLARLVILAREGGGPEFLRSCASALALVWGTRLAQLAQAAVTVENRERLPAEKGPTVYLFTHQSFLDFAFVPLAVAARAPVEELASTNCLPCFLIAKDHFRDNVLFYRLLGIGRAAEAMGMIFVERRFKGNARAAIDVTDAATSVLLEGKSAIAIFPQGTRAAAYVGPKGERLDGAYYTAGQRSRIRQDGKHLKKGAAYIASAAARRSVGLGIPPVRVVPVAISGTGLVCPRGSAKLLDNVHVRLRVGEPIAVDLHAAVSVEHLHARIDGSLKAAGRVHAELERRFFEDMRKFLEPMEIEEIAIAMKTWRGEDFLVHAILDAIYACPPRRWRPFIGELAHALRNFSTREELLALKGRVAEAVAL